MSYLLEDMEKTASKSDYEKLNRYFQKHPDKALATLSEMKDAAKWAGTSTKHLSKKMLRKEKTAEQEKTAAKRVKFNIDDYMRGDDLARGRIALGVKYREIKKADLKDLFKDPRFEAERFGTSYRKKIPKKDWTKEHLNELPYASVAESFNEDYLNYLGDVSDHVHKKQQLRRGLGTAAGLAAIGGGAHLYHRYKKKKRAQAEQEKVAARQFKDFEDFKNSMPKDKKKAANLKFSPDDFEWGEYDAGLGYNFEGARRWHHDTYKADPKEKETIDNLYRSMHKDYQSFTKEQAAAKGDYEKALSRGKTMQRAGLGVSAGGAGLALLAGSGKLPKNLKVPAAAAGTVATIGGLGVRRKGRSLTKKEREKYNQLEIDYGKRHEEKINTPAFKNYWNSVHDHWGDWGQWMGPHSNEE